MALITRVSRLFRADLHAVLDRIEEPDVLLRQAVREMEEALARDEQRLKALNYERVQLLSRESEIEQYWLRSGRSWTSVLNPGRTTWPVRSSSVSSKRSDFARY